MVSTLFADVTPLLEATAAASAAAVISDLLDLLGPQRVPPAKLAGRAGLAALWGGADPHALGVLAVTGRVAEWIRAIPLGPEPHSDERRYLAPALPLVQGLLAVSASVARGLSATTDNKTPALPEPILPAEVTHPEGPLGALREALAQRDATQAARILLGYHATGADYRSLIASLYGVLDYRYPADGHPLIFAWTGGRILDMAEWGGNMPSFISWYAPLLVDNAADSPVAAAARAFGTAREHDLAWLRTRLAIPNEEAAGPQFQRALLAGDATAACAALLAALRGGATPRGVAAGMALAVADLIAALPEGDRAGLLRAGHVLLYVHAVHMGMAQAQDPHVWPVLYTAAAAVNSLRASGAGAALEARRAPVSVGGGGLMAPTMLRSFEAQLGAGDATAALATARRYAQMGHPPRALAGILGGVAAMRDAGGGDAEALHTLPLVAAAAEEYLMAPAALQSGGQNALLAAAIRLATELRGSHAVADRTRAAIDARLSEAG